MAQADSPPPIYGGTVSISPHGGAAASAVGSQDHFYLCLFGKKTRQKKDAVKLVAPLHEELNLHGSASSSQYDSIIHLGAAWCSPPSVTEQLRSGSPASNLLLKSTSAPVSVLAAESWRVLKGLHEKSGVFSSDTSFGNIRCVSWLSKISSQELCAETQSHYILREIPLITVLARTHSENRPETRVC
ncbi:hypothetical protein F2P81_024395 [Scophthalmus maximus]|uniref:Uncharacterized protein n=1 Tax=Scophthalmus maximus TaxID=52904 RepID=A0A6A4RU53_SCOMX|nr:hypothetical protein F2P81_024395 [Scophthalmus maximus]